MKKSLHLIAVVFILTTLASCDDQIGTTTGVTFQNIALARMAESSNADASSPGYSGAVVEYLNAGNYTYVQVDTGTKKIWAAAPAFKVAVGDRVVVPPGMAMINFHSKSIGRTFDLVYFVGRIRSADSTHGGGQALEKQSGIAEMDFSKIVRPDGGKTVAEIYQQKTELSGVEIIVRGKVVKYNPAIMGRNWIHLRDGSGTDGTNDLSLTTSAKAAVGDTIVATGVLLIDKDYGAGYKYPLIIENAEITVE